MTRHAIQENVQALIDTWPLEKRPHQTCIDAGPREACQPCVGKIMAAFGELYDDVPADRVRTRVAIDAHTSHVEGR
jgi:hypothetical protein